MADRCFGCTSKYKFREKPRVCPQCNRNFCSKCLDPKKGRETCVYCAQKSVYRKEEKEIVQNFQEHFNKHKRHHRAPPTVTRLQLDTSRIQTQQQNAPGDPEKPYISGKLAPEDQEIADRLQKLRESRSSDKEEVSEEDMKERLDKLRGEQPKDQLSTPSVSGGNPAAAAGTDVEKADHLMEQMEGEVRLDKRLADSHGNKEDELFDRFSALTGREQNSKPAISSPDAEAGDNGQEPEDPEKVLRDLKAMTVDEERKAALALQGNDMKTLVEGGPNDQFPDISYPTKDKQKGEEEIAKLMEMAKEENRLEENALKDDQQFISESSKHLARLRDEDDKEEEVRSKPAAAAAKRDLEFQWRHFSGSQASNAPGAVSSIVDWMDEDDSDFDQQVHELLEQMAVEGKLDERLERDGLTHIVEREKENDSQARPLPSSSAAAAATPYGAFGEDDLPWCCICNEDAVIRCFDCSSDLYCLRCFSEGHQQFGLFDHRYAPYEPPKKSN